MTKITTKRRGREIPGIGLSVPAALLAAAAVFTGVACNNMTATDARPEPMAIAARGSSIAQPTDISTLAQLRTMSPTGNYRLIKDITMNGTDAGFIPIGTFMQSFSGTFDGNGFSIINFRTANDVNSPGYYRGLFGIADGAILKNIHLTNVNVMGQALTGAIVGYMTNTLLTDSYVAGGTVSGPTSTNSPGNAVGMAVGSAGTHSEIHRCYATGSVKGVLFSIGGFLGEVYGYGLASGSDDPRVIVDEVYTKVDVNATPPGTGYEGVDVAAGGIVGLAQGAVITDLYAAGNVKGRNSPGGLVGRVINDDPSTMPSILHKGVYIGDVASTSGPARAGAIGSLSGYFQPGSRCAVFYNKTVDGGAAIPTSDVTCNQGKTTQELQQPHYFPTKLFYPYTIGTVVTQAMIGSGDYMPCKLASGSDDDWGFGTCGSTRIWLTNADNQYNTLANIPNPTIQVLQ
jgi:hypothetical protein